MNFSDRVERVLVLAEKATLDAEPDETPGAGRVQVLTVDRVPVLGDLISEPGSGHRFGRQHMGDRLDLAHPLVGLEDLGGVECVQVRSHSFAFVLPLGSPVVGVVGPAFLVLGVLVHRWGEGGM